MKECSAETGSNSDSLSQSLRLKTAVISDGSFSRNVRTWSFGTNAGGKHGRHKLRRTKLQEQLNSAAETKQFKLEPAVTERNRTPEKMSRKHLCSHVRKLNPDGNMSWSSMMESKSSKDSPSLWVLRQPLLVHLSGFSSLIPVLLLWCWSLFLHGYLHK